MNITVLSKNDAIFACWIAARNCYCYDNEKMKDLINKEYKKDIAINLLKNIFKNGHLSIFEHATFQLFIEDVSRSLLAQFTRHRIGWSYAVQSQHFQTHKKFRYKELEQYISDDQKQQYHQIMNSISDFYDNAINSGLPKYIAREILPNACYTRIVATTNLRALINFWQLRNGKENTPEIKLMSDKIYEAIITCEPLIKEIYKYNDK